MRVIKCRMTSDFLGELLQTGSQMIPHEVVDGLPEGAMLVQLSLSDDLEIATAVFVSETEGPLYEEKTIMLKHYQFDFPEEKGDGEQG
jgi:hypothetical protein